MSYRCTNAVDFVWKKLKGKKSKLYCVEVINHKCLQNYSLVEGEIVGVELGKKNHQEVVRLRVTHYKINQLLLLKEKPKNSF